MKQLTKFLLELGPLVTFFLVNAYYGIFPATAIFMVAITISLVASWVLFKKIAAMPLVTAVFVIVFGGLTLYLQDETFIKVKPTIVNCMFAGILFSGLYFGRLFLKIVFEEAFQLSDEGWKKLTIRWGGFFLFLALLNEVVWRGADFYYIPQGELTAAALEQAKKTATDLWVNFKVFGIMPLTMVFAMTQLGLITKYSTESEKSDNAEAKPQ